MNINNTQVQVDPQAGSLIFGVVDQNGDISGVAGNEWAFQAATTK